jgi:hypothetical protein
MLRHAVSPNTLPFRGEWLSVPRVCPLFVCQETTPTLDPLLCPFSAPSSYLMRGELGNTLAFN